MERINFEKMIGVNFQNVFKETKSLVLENNEFELEIDERIDEDFYVKSKDGSFEMILNNEKRIKTIFLYPNDNGVFPFEDYTVHMGRNEIRQKNGEPNRQGEPIENSIIGTNGGYDRYDKEIVFHFEYTDKTQTTLKMITLMSIDTAP